MAGLAAPLALQRNLLLGVLLALAAAAWVVLAWQAADLPMVMSSPTMGLSAPLFLTLWVVMMVAMMFPTAAPMILTFQRIQATRAERGQPFVATWIFVAAYLAIWTAFGGLAYVAATLAQLAAAAAMVPPLAAARVGGGVLMLAGLYQLSPLKHLCLSKCRTPLAFLLTSWREGIDGAVRMGLAHGMYCLGCCWLLFVILFPLGMMNVALMALITLLIFAEKTLPLGHRIGQVAAVVLLLYGAVVLVVPEVLPTFMSSAPMAMPEMPLPASPPSGGAPAMPGGAMPGM